VLRRACTPNLSQTGPFSPKLHRWVGGSEGGDGQNKGMGASTSFFLLALCLTNLGACSANVSSGDNRNLRGEKVGGGGGEGVG
jgi:hypothetical protein